MGINDTLSSLKDILVGLDNAQAMGTLIELQQQAYSILDENRELRLKLEDIQRLDEMSHKLTFRSNAYFLEGDENPYCTKCWDADKKMVHLTKTERASMRLGNKICTNCKSYYTV